MNGEDLQKDSLNSADRGSYRPVPFGPFRGAYWLKTCALCQFQERTALEVTPSAKGGRGTRFHEARG